MKRTTLFQAFAFVAAFCISGAVAAAQTIDKPAATVKLIRTEIYSVRQFKADIDKLEAATGQKLNADARNKLLESQINTILFRQYCEREKIIVSDAEVNTSIAQMKSQLGPGTDDARLEASLRSQGVYVDAATFVHQQMLLSKYIQSKRADDIKSIKNPTPDEVLHTYDLMKSTLVRPDTVRVSIIYVDLRGKGADDRKKGEDIMKSLAAQVRSNPSKFDELLLKSTDPAAGYKGTPSMLVEKTPQAQTVYGTEFMSAVFGLKPGEISALIQNQAGFQVVRLNESLPQKQLTLSDPLPGQPNATVQDYIVYQLTMQKRNELLDKIQQELIGELRKEGTVKTYDENLSF